MRTASLGGWGLIVSDLLMIEPSCPKYVQGFQNQVIFVSREIDSTIMQQALLQQSAFHSQPIFCRAASENSLYLFPSDKSSKYKTGMKTLSRTVFERSPWCSRISAELQSPSRRRLVLAEQGSHPAWLRVDDTKVSRKTFCRFLLAIGAVAAPPTPLSPFTTQKSHPCDHKPAKQCHNKTISSFIQHQTL